MTNHLTEVLNFLMLINKKVFVYFRQKLSIQMLQKYVRSLRQDLGTFKPNYDIFCRKNSNSRKFARKT